MQHPVIAANASTAVAIAASSNSNGQSTVGPIFPVCACARIAGQRKQSRETMVREGQANVYARRHMNREYQSQSQTPANATPMGKATK